MSDLAKDGNAEEWRQVVGFEGWYEVSSLGRVRRVSTGMALKPQPNWQGYYRVSLSRPGKKQRRFLHLVVAEAFLGPCPDGHEVNHIEGRSVNRSDRLEYVAGRKENMRHYLSSPAAANRPKPCEPRLTEAAVRHIRASYPQVSILKLAKIHGVLPSTVHAALHRRTWRHVA